jgi:OOP family OmpA-OmpF porin/outer membrane immunogenic protein
MTQGRTDQSFLTSSRIQSTRELLMMKSNCLKILGLAALLCGNVAAAGSWQTSNYTGLAYIDENELDDDSFSSSLSLVYRFTDTLGVEGGYTTFGEFENKFDTVEGPAKVKADIDGFTLGLNVEADLSDTWFMTGRIGMWMWDGNSTLKIPGSATLKGDDDGTDLYAGVSIDYRFTPRWGAGLGASYYSVDLDGSDTGVFLVGMHTSWRF